MIGDLIPCLVYLAMFIAAAVLHVRRRTRAKQRDLANVIEWHAARRRGEI